MIPDFNHSGVLPPFLPGLNPTIPNANSPYKVSLLEFVQKFCTSKSRYDIISGYLNYRIALKSIGIKEGFQWIDGSFVENIEIHGGRNPSDLDIVTFGTRPEHVSNNSNWKRFFLTNQKLFSPEENKKLFQCDAYYIDLSLPSRALVNNTQYWFGLFSHQRDTFLWKGMLEIPLAESEHLAKQFLSAGAPYDS